MHLFLKNIVLVVLATLMSCKGQTSKEIELLDAQLFSDKINATLNPQIIDVRTPFEFQAENIENSKNVDWLAEDFVINMSKFEKSKPIFVYCKSGGRSSQASEKLAELGFKKIFELQGGIMRWNAVIPSKGIKKIVGLSISQYQQLLENKKIVLINFYADWCAPCKKMKPYLIRIEKESQGKIALIKLNADENKTLIQELKIDALPTLLLYEDQKIKWKHSGFISETDLRQKLQ
jgi:thioredoxin